MLLILSLLNDSLVLSVDVRYRVQYTLRIMFERNFVLVLWIL